jgi:hypothetical protein
MDRPEVRNLIPASWLARSSSWPGRSPRSAALGRARLAKGAPPLSMTAASVRKDIGELTGRHDAQ